jgi:hypothetical protein
MKTRYMHDYVCIPSVLREHGYRTEMVIGYHRDLNRLHLFMSEMASTNCSIGAISLLGLKRSECRPASASPMGPCWI